MSRSGRYMTAGLVCLALLLNPIALKGLESAMVSYMLVQIPGLVAGGYWIGRALEPRIPDGLKSLGLNSNGVPGLLAALFVIVYWILPRSVDAALNEWTVELAKLVTLPWAAGIPLAWSWHKLNGMGRGLVWANLIPMLFVMGWLYWSAPVRLCNNYLAWQQELLGKSMLLAGSLLAITFVVRAFTGSSNKVEVADTV